jgi:hypothetical protein
MKYSEQRKDNHCVENRIKALSFLTLSGETRQIKKELTISQWFHGYLGQPE